MDEILRLAAYHTLTVTLLATTQWSAGLSAPELLDELNRTGFDLTGVAEEIRYLHNAGEPGAGDVEENRTFIEHMSRVFDLSKLGERHRFIAWLCNLPFLRRFFWKCTHSTALYALRGMSLLAPNTPTPIQDVEKWLNLPNLNGVNRAAEAGWLVQGTEKGVRCVSIHPVVSAVVRRAYPPEAEIVDALAGRLCEDMCYKETEVFITRLPILKHAVALDRAANPLNLRTGSYGHMLIQMGYLLKKQGNYESALSKYLWGVEIEKDVLGPIHLDVAATYSKIGIVYRILQDYLRAKEYYQNSFLIRKEILGNEHPDTAISYSDIGEVYCGQGDYSHALEYCQKALQLIEKASGPKHRYMAITFNIIGNIYYVQENYSQAFAYYQKAKQIFEEILGQEHPTTAHPYHNIGVLFYQQGNYREALNWLEKAFSIRLNVLGANHPRTKSTQEWLDKTRRALSEEGGTPS
ncbi:MAG: tetratricopeptide repeat protein [Oscillibacter sp.]|nr:tetratricopeptide repeat protein [Oscillibacter sp.]